MGKGLVLFAVRKFALLKYGGSIYEREFLFPKISTCSYMREHHVSIHKHIHIQVVTTSITSLQFLTNGSANVIKGF